MTAGARAGVDRPRLLIGGEWVVVDEGYEVRNPATEEVVGVAPDAGADLAVAAAAAAATALRAWSQTAPEERAADLDRAADELLARGDELVRLAQAEHGCTLASAAGFHVDGTVGRLRRFARGALEPTVVPIPPTPAPATSPSASGGGLVAAVATRQPVGVVACITPYNAPLANAATKVGPALAMGNTVVLKPAPQDPLAVLVLAEAFVAAGLPPGVLNVVTEAGAAAGRALVASPDVDMISFTGSTAVGTDIAREAAGSMKRLLLELGGKGAAVVFPDADLDAATAGIASTWTFYAGQICTAPSRVVVHRSVHDELAARLASVARTIAVGDPLDPATVVGPVISGGQRDLVEALVGAARDAGAEVLAGGGRPDLPRGHYVQPTLLDVAGPDNVAASTEIFGPVVTMLTFDDDDEAVEIANATQYGLHDYVYSGSTARAHDVARRLRSGTVGVNTIQRNAEAPFGGCKRSGVGRDGGSFALQAYSELQSVLFPS